MDTFQDLLVEIGTEELPPKALLGLSNAFTDLIGEELAKAELQHGSVLPFATPRRLAVIVKDLQVAQSDKTVQRRGPALQAAFDADGQPSKAALGFARSCGVDSVDALQRLETDKGAWLVYDTTVAGKSAAQLLPAVVTTALEKLPIPKRMRWGASNVQFVRPVHWIVMLLGYDVVEAQILDLTSGRHTQGHRFHRPMEISLEHPNDYQESLEVNGQVVAEFTKRRLRIQQQVDDLASQAGGKAVIDDDLLDEVTSMVEWPVAVMGSFDRRFLEVPAEVLVTTMKTHQKYFYLRDAQGELLPHFITVSNIDSKDMAVVRQGNERVVMPRLVDAEFFWNQDRKQTLANFAERLRNVVFQAKLGSMFDKQQRTDQLCQHIATQLDADVGQASRAAQLSKADLMTDMVGEFPNLQGIMGKYYALSGGESQQVAQALEEQYQPRFAGDAIPASRTGQILAIADKLDSLCGIFAIGQSPSGDKDPFGLRRSALGIMRIMVEAEIELDMVVLIQKAIALYSEQAGISAAPDAVENIYQFMLERLRAYYADKGVVAEVFDAVLAQHPVHPFDFHRRINAVSEFIRMPEAESLATANKRIANIIRKAEYQANTVFIDASLFEQDSERALAQQIDHMEQAIQPALAQGNYQDALSQLSGLRDTVDSFFDDVMVMSEDSALRNNRLALLSRLRGLFLEVADISRLHIG